MSIKAVGWAFDQKLSDPMAKLVLLAVADHYNESSGDAWPSVERLMEYTEASRSTVLRKLKKLETTGLISRTKRYNNTDLYRINFGGCHSDTSHSDIFEVSQRHTNHKRTVNNNIKGKQKLSEWSPSDEDLAYAQQQGVDADDVLESIRLWDEQNGNKAAYVSCSAFWKQWCRKEGKRSQRPSQQARGGSISPRQKELIESLVDQAYKREQQGDRYFLGEDYDLLRKTLTEAMLAGKLKETCEAMTLRFR